MDKKKLSAIINRGFREGANERHNAGIKISEVKDNITLNIPNAPSDIVDPIETKAWIEGYALGYKIGASDADLSTVENPGKHGMLSGIGEQMLEMFGIFNKLNDNQ